jgi:hypothetical protein
MSQRSGTSRGRAAGREGLRWVQSGCRDLLPTDRRVQAGGGATFYAGRRAKGGAVARWRDLSGAPHSNKIGLLLTSSRRFAGTGDVLPSKFLY